MIWRRVPDPRPPPPPWLTSCSRVPHLLWMPLLDAPLFLLQAAACLVATVRHGQGEWALGPAAPPMPPLLLHLAAAPFHTLVFGLGRCERASQPQICRLGPPVSA